MNIDKLAQSVQVVAVVSGVVLSVMSFNNAKEIEIEARVIEAETRRIEAIAPFYNLRQERYVEISKISAILSDSKSYNDTEIKEATKRFRALYISELSMVESGDVESKMKDLAKAIAPDLLLFTSAQKAAFNLSHALKDSFTYDK